MAMFLHSLFLKRQEADILLRNGCKSEQSSTKSNSESLTTPYITGKKRQGPRQHKGTLPQTPASHSTSWACPDSMCLFISQTLIGFSPDFLLLELMLPTVCSATTTSTGLAIYSSRMHSLFTLFHQPIILCLQNLSSPSSSHLFFRLKRSSLLN